MKEPSLPCSVLQEQMKEEDNQASPGGGGGIRGVVNQIKLLVINILAKCLANLAHHCVLSCLTAMS